MAELLASCWQILGVVVAIIGILVGLIILTTIILCIAVAIVGKKGGDGKKN